MSPLSSRIASWAVVARFVGLSLLATACGGGGGGSDASGNSAPTISAFTFSPQAVYVNASSGTQSIVGNVDYADRDGDISSLTMTVLDSSGRTVDSITSPIEGVSGSRSGTIEGEFLVDTTTAGNYTVQLYLTDARSNRSNQLSLAFRIAEFPWVARRPMPSARRDFATASIGGRIYLLGGGDMSAGITPAPPVMRVDVYDPATDSWTTAPPMLVAVTDCVAVAAAGKLYVIGGSTDITPMVDTVQEYDPVTQLWTLKAPMPTERESAAAAVLNDRIYVVGGSAAAFDLATVEVYDPASDTWAAEAPLAAPRRDLAAAAIGGKVLALGGYTGAYVPDGGYRKEVAAFDPVTRTWTSVADMLVARSDFAVGVIGGRLFAAGGGNFAPALDDVTAYDLAGNAWSGKTSMPIALAWPRAEVVNGRMYVFDSYVTFEYTPGNDLL